MEDKLYCTNKTVEVYEPEKCNVNTISIQNSSNKDNITVIDNNNCNFNYFPPGPSKKLKK